jgi:hypothetical protein
MQQHSSNLHPRVHPPSPFLWCRVRVNGELALQMPLPLPNRRDGSAGVVTFRLDGLHLVFHTNYYHRGGKNKMLMYCFHAYNDSKRECFGGLHCFTSPRAAAEARFPSTVVATHVVVEAAFFRPTHE